MTAITGTRYTEIRTTMATTTSSPPDSKQTFVYFDFRFGWTAVSSKILQRFLQSKLDKIAKEITHPCISRLNGEIKV